MTAKVVKDRTASVRERLLNLARRRGEDFQITLRNYLFERFLYRLSLSDVKERFVVVSFDENSIVVEPIRADEEYAGVRATFEARLALFANGSRLMSDSGIYFGRQRRNSPIRSRWGKRHRSCTPIVRRR